VSDTDDVLAQQLQTARSEHDHAIAALESQMLEHLTIEEEALEALHERTAESENLRVCHGVPLYSCVFVCLMYVHQARVETLNSDISATRTLLADSQTQIRALEDESASLRKDLSVSEEARRQVSMQGADRARVAAEESAADREALGSAKRELEDQCGVLNEAVRLGDVQLRAAAVEIDDLRSATKALTEERRQLRDALKTVQDTRDVKEQRIQALEDALSRAISDAAARQGTE
jgi:chromosome segregation ATPase